MREGGSNREIAAGKHTDMSLVVIAHSACLEYLNGIRIRVIRRKQRVMLRLGAYLSLGSSFPALPLAHCCGKPKINMPGHSFTTHPDN